LAERVADGEDAGGADEHARRVEVVGQEAEQRAGQERAQNGHDRLARVLERDDAQRRDGNEGNAGQEAVEAVDEVDAVEHAHDPQRRRGDRGTVEERYPDITERVGQPVDHDAERQRDRREDDLADELPSRTESQTIVEVAQEGTDGDADEERDDMLRGHGLERRELEDGVDGQPGQADDYERGGDRQAAGARDRSRMDAPLVIGNVDRAQLGGEADGQWRENEADGRRREQGGKSHR